MAIYRKEVGKNVPARKRQKSVKYSMYKEPKYQNNDFRKRAMAIGYSMGNKRMLQNEDYHSTTNIGYPIGVGTAKRHVKIDTRTDTPTRILQVLEASDIPKQTTSDEHDRRDGDIIRLLGIQIIFRIVNSLSDVPLTVNYCMIAPRARNNDAVVATDFFRDNATGRGRNFDTTLSNMDMSTLPINTDMYTILYHKRTMIMQGANTPTGRFHSKTKDSWHEFNHYQEIKRQIRYEDNVTISPVFFAWWIDGYFNPPSATTVANAATVTLKAITYFKEETNN